MGTLSSGSWYCPSYIWRMRPNGNFCFPRHDWLTLWPRFSRSRRVSHTHDSHLMVSFLCIMYQTRPCLYNMLTIENFRDPLDAVEVRYRLYIIPSQLGPISPLITRTIITFGRLCHGWKQVSFLTQMHLCWDPEILYCKHTILLWYAFYQFLRIFHCYRSSKSILGADHSTFL